MQLEEGQKNINKDPAELSEELVEQYDFSKEGHVYDIR